jgi:iron complex outermembrane receptor protein
MSKRYSVVALVTTTFLATPVFAQDSADQGAVTSSQEIIVTAQRREERALDVPLSIQVASGEQLQRQGIQTLTSLQLTTPGFQTQTNSGFTQIFMRGVGNAIYLGADPSVATFVDDVPRIYGSMTDNLVDVQRIEVLKGAQGGLYGRNATGGVVNIITKQPALEEFKGDALVTYGERQTFRAAGFVNVPIGDKIALSVSGERATHDPYVKNLATPNPYSAANFPTGAFLPVPNGTPPIQAAPGVTVYNYTPEQTAAFFNQPLSKVYKLNDQDFWAVKGKLLFQPIDELKIVLAADYYKKNDNSGAGQANYTPDLTLAAVRAYFGLFGVNAVLPDDFVKGATRKFTAYQGVPIATPVREYGFSGTVTYSAPTFDITSITAYRNQKTGLLADANSSNVASALLKVDFKKHFFYQELRALSTFEGPFSLIFGGSYLENSQAGGQQVFLLNNAFQVGNTLVSDKIKNWSIYAQAGYDFTDKLNVTVSGRYIHEKNNASFTLPLVSDAETVQKKFVPSVTVKYDLDNGNVYARWARGFKTGGINLATATGYYPNPRTDGSIFGPETVDTYEAGIKYATMDNRLRLTAAVFYNDYKNLQVDTRARPAYPQLTTAVVNAKSARTWGVEGSATLRVSDPLTLGVTAGYLNAKYKNFKLTGSAVLEDFDQSGLVMTHSPKWQMSFNADFDQPLNDDFRLVSNVLVSHTTSQVLQRSPAAGVIPDALAPGYWLVNARIGLKTTDDRYGIALVADNLFDEQYFTFGQSAFTSVTTGAAPPRIIRGEVTVKF